MRYVVQVLLVIIFFLLPIYMDILQVNMFTYINLGFYSAFPAPVLSLAVYAAAIILLLSPLWIMKKNSSVINLIALIIVFIPIIQVMSRQWQFHSAWSILSYSVFLLLCIISVVLSTKKQMPFKKE